MKLRARGFIVPGMIAASYFAVTATAVASQPSHKWSVRLEGGQAEMHRASSKGRMVHVAVDKRMFASGLIGWQLAVSGSSADEGFGILSWGLELQPFPNSRITPFAAGHIGILGEPEYAGPFLTGSVGLSISLTSRASIRGTYTRGNHGGEDGPHSVRLGVGLGLGRTSEERALRQR